MNPSRRLLMICVLLCVTAGAPAQRTSPTQPQSAPEKVDIALRALMQHYDPERGLWQTEGWWNSANSTTVLGDAAVLQASADIPHTLQSTFVNAQKKFPLFRNEYYDDEGWWALAWIQAYDVTHRKQYLHMAESIFTDMSGGWDDTCGGGIWWKKDRHYKNAIANELFLSVAAHLADREKGENRAAYLDWAQREWHWFQHSGMINSDNLINDGLTPACRNNGKNTWTYNQGVILGGLVELAAVNHDLGAVQEADLIADAAMGRLSDANRVLQDRTEPACSPDSVQFKGIFMRNLSALNRAVPNEAIATFIRSNADSIWSQARTDETEFSCSWSGPPSAGGAAAQTSALDTLIAAAALH